MTENTDNFEEATPKTLTPEAKRALAEAEERRKAAENANMQKEYGGRGGVEPTRYGDWEKSGIAHDF
jgi:hypothetical protein